MKQKIHATEESALYAFILDQAPEVRISKEFQALLNVYAKYLETRLGVAYLESNEYTRHTLAEETGVKLHTLKVYAYRAYNYFPPLCPKRGTWSNEDDNYIMAYYQRKELKTIFNYFKNRTVNAIIKRAGVLGVSRER